MDKRDLDEMDYLRSAKEIWENTGEDEPNKALWAIAAALISLAESHKRVADALEALEPGRIAAQREAEEEADDPFTEMIR